MTILGLLICLAVPVTAQTEGDPPGGPDSTGSAGQPAPDHGSETLNEPGQAGPERSAAAELIAKIKEAREIGVILIILSILGLGFVIERLMNLRRKAIVPEGLADRVLDDLKAGRYDEADAACRQQPSTMARVLRSVIRHRSFSFADLNLIAGDIASREVQQHAQRCYPIAIVATVAPLLGLLGTVIGMIEAFEKVALMGEMGDPSVMASAISYALVTTAMGLIIAAPNVALYRVFRMRTAKLAARMDEQVSEVISVWQEHRQARPAPAHAESPAGPAKVEVNT